MCPLCPLLAAGVGVCAASASSVNSKRKALHVMATTILTVVTVIALKVFFNISLCQNGKRDMYTILRVSILGLGIALAYSFAVKCLLKRIYLI